ncbi:dipeptidyl aminopeptidase, partial [Streptococcus pneumoniae]|nr:dipeptidyl aminopeptidase [Streptococcus pneumoniae]
VIYEALKSKNPQTKLQVFESESGADAHCQVNNLRLAHNIVFDWLDTLFEWNRLNF